MREAVKLAALCLAVLAGALAVNVGTGAVRPAIRGNEPVTADCSAGHLAVIVTVHFEQGHDNEAPSLVPSFVVSPVCDHSPEDYRR
jgi:hypothetical protein